MGSVISHAACPKCHLIATVDYYYKSDEIYFICAHCGYNYSRFYRLFDTDDEIGFRDELVIDEQEGYGVYVLRKKDGDGATLLFNCPITEEDIRNFEEQYNSKETIQERSYLVRFENGEFKVLVGTLPESFFTTCETTIPPEMLSLWEEK